MRKLLIAAGALLMAASPALAQTPTSYPPPDPGGEDEVVTINHGRLTEGQTITFRSCGFGEDPAVFFNTSLVDESDEIDGAGCAEQVLTVIEDGEPDAALGGPTLAAIRAPIQLAQAGETPVVEIEGQRFAARGNGRQNVVQNIGISRDGDDRFVRHLFTLGQGGDAGRGRGRGALARTGATVVRWGLPGVALLGVGGLLVLAARRRNATN